MPRLKRTNSISSMGEPEAPGRSDSVLALGTAPISASDPSARSIPFKSVIKVFCVTAKVRV